MSKDYGVHDRYYVFHEGRLIKILQKYGCKYPVACQIVDEIITDKSNGIKQTPVVKEVL
jgi:hypothetical protein